LHSTNSKKKKIQDLLGNKENEYLVPEYNISMINVTTEVNDTHKNFLKEEIMDEITEKLTEKLQDMVNKKV
jgi:hypothetical protein